MTAVIPREAGNCDGQAETARICREANHLGRTGSLWLGAMLLAVAWLGLAGEAWAWDGQGHSSRTLYQSYCAACHGDLGQEAGAYQGSLRPAAPDLRKLKRTHGAPLPRAALVHFVLDPRRTGSARVCSRRPLAWAVPGLGTWSMRRGMVLSVLQYLETLQLPAGPGLAVPTGAGP